METSRELTRPLERPEELEASGIVDSLSWTHLEIEPQATWETWVALGQILRALRDRKEKELSAIQWWIGDWLRYGEFEFGEKFAQAVEITGWKESTLLGYQWVASKFEPERRRDSLSIGHHVAAAGFEDPSDADRVLDAVEEAEATPSVSETRRLVREVKDEATGRDPDEEAVRRACALVVRRLKEVDVDLWGDLLVDHLFDPLRHELSAVAYSEITRRISDRLH